MPSAAPRLRRKTHLIIGLSLLACMLVGMVSIGPLLGTFVFERLRDQVVAELGGRLSVDSFEADFLRGSFRFTNFVYEEEREARSIFLSAKEGELDISLGSLFRREGFIVEDLRLESPIVRYKQSKSSADASALRRGVQIKKLQLADGRLLFEDLAGANPVRIEFEELNVSGEDLSTHQPLQLCSHVSVTAKVAGAPFEVQGSGGLDWRDAGMDATESCRFTGIVVPPLLPYLIEGLPIQATAGLLDGEVSLIPMGGGAIRMKALLQFKGLQLDLGTGATAFMAKSTGVPQAIEAKKGTFSFIMRQDFSREEANGYVGDFLRKFLALTWQQAMITLTTTR